MDVSSSSAYAPRSERSAVTERVNQLRAGRIVAIDAFRGITFLAMIFVNELGGVSGITRWLKHMPANADAMSFPDIVFPAFLFIVGMSIPFAVDARIAKGDSLWGVQKHILVRALALIVMGVFMVNAEEGFNAQAMPIPIHLWSLLFYVAVYLVWGAFGSLDTRVERALRVAGVLLMAGLALLYRGGPDGTQWMRPQWWGILGLIGWAYFFSSEFYLLSRGRLRVLVGLLALCVAYYAMAHKLDVPREMKWLFSQEAHAAHSQIVLAGVICTLIFFDTRRGDTQAQRFAQAGLFAAVLLVAGWGLHAVFPISKIYATPTWCLWCAAICVALFALLHWLIDLRGRTRWVRLVAPAAASPLVTYLIPFVVEALLLLAGLALPAVLRQGTAGLLWAAAYAGLVVWVVSLLNRRGVRLTL